MAQKQFMPDLSALRKEQKKISEVKKSVELLKEIDLFSCTASITEEVAYLWLLARYGIEKILSICQSWNELPKTLTSLQTIRYISQFCELPESKVKQILSIIESSCPSLFKMMVIRKGIPIVLAPPVKTCIQCGRNLVSYHTCKVRYYTEEGASIVDKVTLRCIECKLYYNLTQYGDKSAVGFRFYKTGGDVVEATDTVVAKRSLLELQCALANHSWVSFQGFAESYNVALQLPKDLEMTPEIAAELFYNGELELELKTIGRLEYPFYLNCDREKCFEEVEALRRTSVYSHPHSECFSGCKERGCGTLWVTDGIWKVNFPHCMYRVETSIDGLNIQLPNVCTESPVRGKAFCTDHCNLIEQEANQIPTGLLEFLKFCKNDATQCNDDIEVVERTLRQLPPSSVPLEQSAAASQGTYNLIKHNPQIASSDALTIDKELCRKDTGAHRKLRKWSRGHQFIVRGGGHIDTWQPLYMSESPSQVLLILIQWLLSLVEEYGGLSQLPAITLAYDNMCNLDKMRIARQPLPLPPPFNMLWLNVHKIIDVFHYPNHIGTSCKTLYSPEKFKELHPNYNTQAGEQTFSWISRYKRILCAMTKNHHLFYLHRMIRRRNAYTARCYHYGRTPILPKKRT